MIFLEHPQLASPTIGIRVNFKGIMIQYLMLIAAHAESREVEYSEALPVMKTRPGMQVVWVVCMLLGNQITRQPNHF